MFAYGRMCVYCLACSLFSVALCGRMVNDVRICWLSPKAAVCTHLTKKSNYPMSCILSYIEALSRKPSGLYTPSYSSGYAPRHRRLPMALRFGNECCDRTCSILQLRVDTEPPSSSRNHHPSGRHPPGTSSGNCLA